MPMTSDEQIKTILDECHAAGYPPTISKALGDYLAGTDSLEQVEEAWQSLRRRSWLPLNMLLRFSGPSGSQLSEVDYRLIDLCVMLDYGEQLLRLLVDDQRVEEVYAYLLRKGMEERAGLQLLLRLGDSLVRPGGKPTSAGRLILGALPRQPALLYDMVASSRLSDRFVTTVRLLVAADPPLIDEACELAQQAPHDAIGKCITLMFRAAPTRFGDWARIQLADETLPEGTRMEIIYALIAYDPDSRHQIADYLLSRPLRSYGSWEAVRLYQESVELLYRNDPETYWPAVVEVALSDNYGYRMHNLLDGSSHPAAVQALREIVEQGKGQLPFKAAELLLRRVWEGKEEYALGLLAHRSKLVRDLVVTWATRRGVELLGPAGALLSHTNVDARLGAVSILGGLGGEAHALLRARLEAEPSQNVRQAIIDVVGEQIAPAGDSSPVAAFLAQAAAAFERVDRPTLPRGDQRLIAELRWRGGKPIPRDAFDYLLYRQLRSKSPRLDEALREIVAQIDRRSSADLALSIFEEWLRRGPDTREYWLLPLIGALGDDRLVPLLRQHIRRWTAGEYGVLATKATHALSLIDSVPALGEIDEMIGRVGHGQVQGAARESFRIAAEARGLSLEELSDVVALRVGFDERGEQELVLGERRLRLMLGPGLDLQAHDEQGSPLPGLARTLKGDDLARFKELRDQVRHVGKQQIARMERALVQRRAWPAGLWRALLRHPVLRSLATTLVWGLSEPGGDGYALLFRPLEDGTLVDVQGESVELPAEGDVRLAHPLELAEEQRQQWLAQLARHKLTQPFAQIGRPILRFAPEERERRCWERYAGYRLSGSALKSRYLKAGWKHGSLGDDRGYRSLLKSFPAAGITAILEVDGVRDGWEKQCTATIRRLAFLPSASLVRDGRIDDRLAADERRALPLGEVPPVVFSEAAGDVAAFAAAGELDQESKKVGWG